MSPAHTPAHPGPCTPHEGHREDDEGLRASAAAVLLKSKPRANGWHPQPYVVRGRPKSSHPNVTNATRISNAPPHTEHAPAHRTPSSTRHQPPQDLGRTALSLGPHELRLSATQRSPPISIVHRAPSPSSRPPLRRAPSTPPPDGYSVLCPRNYQAPAYTRSITVHNLR